MEKELEIVKAKLIETYKIDRDNCIIEQFFESPYNDNIQLVYNSNKKAYYVDIENRILYNETEFFYDYILKQENWLTMLYDEWECEDFEEFEKNIVFDDKNNYMIKLKTKFGMLYYRYCENCDFEFTLYDSNMEFLTNVNIGSIDDIKACDSVANLYTNVLGDYVSYADNLNDLLNIINERITENNVNYGCNDKLWTMEDLKDNDYLNRIGKTYVFYMDCI